ncbi:MAG TPA: GWxTD domain-containing protein [Candidatus Krumholzibacteria bacterium]|nr:GWxTD domain-containing protein [Candidatus Krumholzibacteria bacterium]
MRPVRLLVVLMAGVIVICLAPGNPRAAHPKKISQKEVRHRVALLSPSLAHEVGAMQYLLRPAELADLLTPPDDAHCRAWIDAYWSTRDPVYTTPVNEARAEHERRVTVAETYFARGAWPGWDDRGQVFIRYGAPGGHSRVAAEVADPGMYIPAQEYWYYPLFDMYVRFADPTGSGRFFLYLEGVQLPVGDRSRNDRRTMASKWNPDRPMDYMRLDADALDFEGLVPPFPEKGYDDFMKRVYRYYDVVEATPVVYPFDFAATRVPMSFAVNSFRGGDQVDRVDVSTEFEGSVVPDPGNPGARNFITTTVFWDLHNNELARYARADSLRMDSTAPSPVATVINQTSLTLPPGAYWMAVTVEETGSGRFTSLRRAVVCHEMDDGLALSDLALARRIGPAREDSPFNRGPLEVVPRPSRHYALGAPVPVYFEIYHLGRGLDGSYGYTVEYTITPRSARPRSLWKRLVSRADEPLQVRSSFQSGAAGPDDVVHVAAETSNLWPGEFTLLVTVTDRATFRSASRETTFTLRDKH